MKRSIFGASAVMAALLLSACQGQGWHSNPTAHYSSALAQANRPFNVNAKPVNVTPPDNTQDVCFGAFLVTVQNDQGEKLMTFTEDVPTTYTIEVRSLLGDDFRITAKKPANATFQQIDQSGNVAHYTLSWTPAKNERNQVMSLLYSSTLSNARCGKGTHENLNLIVNKTDGEPTVEFKNIPQNKITFSNTAQVKFQVLVNDPASTKEIGPDLNAREFEAWAAIGDKPALDASTAVDCSQGRLISGTRWQFDCALNIGAIKGVDSKINSGGVTEASFFATATSKRGGKLSTPVKASLLITFPKVEAPAPKPAPIAAAPAPVTKKQVAVTPAPAPTTAATPATEKPSQVIDLDAIKARNAKLTKKQIKALRDADDKAVAKAAKLPLHPNVADDQGDN